MTDRPLPPPPRPHDRRNAWLKIGGAALVALLIVAFLTSLFGSPIGSPDESRRTRHPAGFSICSPLGFVPTIYQRDSRGTDTIRFAPDRSTGRQTILQATRFGAAKPTLGRTAVDTTFQGKPAILEVASTRYDWVWQVTFDRDGAWYHVQITSPIELDVKRDPMFAYVDSFRTETPVSLPTSSPATSQP